MMSNTDTNQASEETLDSIRDRIIHAANNGYSESINDLDYYDKPLQALIRTEKLKARIDELNNFGAIQSQRDLLDRIAELKGGEIV